MKQSNQRLIAYKEDNQVNTYTIDETGKVTLLEKTFRGHNRCDC